MKRFLCVILALIITFGCVLCLAAEPDWNGPDGEDASPTLCDTGRGYIVYYWYTPGIYYSPDGETWTDLSDRSWVKEAADYRYITLGGLGTREFDLLWTGSEYMLRQSLKGDPRPTHTSLLGDSPRNCVVTFLDEDFYVIGEQSFDAPVTAIRYADGTYYATVGGTETAFSRRDWSGEPPKSSVVFSDVPANAWYAPYVDVCVAEGLMEGTGRGLFEPERALTDLECLVLALRLYDVQRGGDGALETLPEGWGQLTLTTADGKQITGKFGEKFDYSSFIRDGNADANLYLTLADSELDWGKSVGGQTATLAYSAKDTCTGTVRVWDPDNDGKNWALSFLPDDPEEQTAIRDLYRESLFHSTWWHSAVYTARVWGLYGAETPQIASLAQSTEGAFTFRRSFALAISEAAGKLKVTNPTAAPTGVSEGDLPAITALYQAGILTGVDGTGDFAPYNTLTRAEAAAMLARVVQPSLRIG